MGNDNLEPENIDAEPENQPEGEAKSGISADLIRGHINTIILRTLYERDKYGYEIIEEIEAKSHGQYSLKQPTLYSALKRLESQGFINAYWKSDEISQGGRRKYYTLTDSGREIAEKNRAEWEYSRTVIDNLISDKNFDFTQPPPTGVDFSILKNSTSRIPTAKDAAREVNYDEPDNNQVVEVVNEEVAPVAEIKPPEEKKEDPAPEAETGTAADAGDAAEKTADLTYSPFEVTSFSCTTSTETIVQQPENVQDTGTPPAAEVTENSDAQQRQSDEEALARHELYKKLVEEPVAKANEEPISPFAENTDTSSLMYNSRPETERDYRSLVNNLFRNTVKNPSQQPQEEPQPLPQPEEIQPQPAVEQTQITVDDDKIKIDTAASMAKRDGLNIETSEYSITAPRKKYSRGAALLKSSLIVGVVMLLEFLLCLIFKNRLGVPVTYPLVILALGIAQALLFTVIYYTDMGKSTRRPTTILYLSACIITCIIAVLIIFLFSILLGVNFADVGDIMSKIIIPCIVALNIPLFGTLFYIFSR